MKVAGFLPAILPLFGLLVAGVSAAEPVEYVRICDAFGAGFHYVPGTDTCLRAENGDQRTQTELGLIRRDSPLAARVRALESKFCDDCFAVVRSDGSSSLSQHLQSSERSGTGKYKVLFRKRLDQCAFDATLGHVSDASPPPPPGLISVAPLAVPKDTGVAVWTYNAQGELADRPFHLNFECKSKPPFCQLSNDGGTGPCPED